MRQSQDDCRKEYVYPVIVIGPLPKVRFLGVCLRVRSPNGKVDVMSMAGGGGTV